MTDTELDNYFVETLKNILSDVKDCAAYVKHLTSDEYKDIKDDYAFIIEDLSWILENCKSIEELAELADEEEPEDDCLDLIDRVYEYILTYCDNYIISALEPQKSKDMQEVEKLQELLDLFIDDEDFEEEEI